MFEKYVEFAKSILQKKENEEIRKLVEEIEELSNKAKKMLEDESEDTGDLIDAGPKIRENLRRLLELALSKEAFELARCLAVLDDGIVKDRAKEVYSRKFENYSSLIDELISMGVLTERTLTLRFNEIAKEVFEDLEEKDFHRLAIEYYEKLADSLDSRSHLAYHCLKAGEIERAFELFIDTANKLYGKHSCIDKLIEVGEKLIKHMKDDDTRCRVIGTLGNLYLMSKRYEEAETNYKTVLNYYSKRVKENPDYAKFVAGVLNNLGNLYFAKGEHKKAESMYIECLRIRMDMNDEDGMVSVLLSLADLYMIEEDYENAEKCFHDALRIELKRSKEDKSKMINVASIVNNLGFLYSRKGDLEKAEKFYKEAIRLYSELSKENPEMLSNLTTALSNLSSLYMSSGNVDKAMNVLEAIKEHWDAIPPDVRATFYLNLAKGLENRGDAKAAEFYLKAGALGFMIFRNYGITAVNFMHCLDKAEQLGDEILKGDAKLIKSAIMKVYYGVKSGLPEVSSYGKRGEALIKAQKGEVVSIDINDEVDMVVYVLANELAMQR